MATGSGQAGASTQSSTTKQSAPVSAKPAKKAPEAQPQSDGLARSQSKAQDPDADSIFANPFRSPPTQPDVDAKNAKPTNALRPEPKSVRPEPKPVPSLFDATEVSFDEPLPPPPAAPPVPLESPFGPKIAKEAPAPKEPAPPLTAAERRRRRRQQAPGPRADSPVLSIHSSPPVSPLRFNPREVMQGWDTPRDEEPVLPFLSLLEKSHAPLPRLPPRPPTFPPPPSSAPPPLNNEAQERRRSRFAPNESSDPFSLPRRRSPSPPRNPFEQFPPVRPVRPLGRGRSPSPVRPALKMVVEEPAEKVLARQRRFGTANADAEAAKPRSISPPPRASPAFAPRPIRWDEDEDDMNFKRRRLL
eukprot:EG_transcript_10587